MTPEKEATLVKAFPHLFRDSKAPLTQSLMAFGCECSDGWYDLIYDACAKMEPIVKKMIDDAIAAKDYDKLDWIPAFIQIKEKYGQLCLYITTYPKEIEKIARAAEKKSAKICEQCGKPGKLRGQGWYYTMCTKCWKQHEERNHGQ
jgi:hypothetical protein